MPNLVVYVPADVARALEAKGVSEDIQRRACKEVLVGLAENGASRRELALQEAQALRQRSPEDAAAVAGVLAAGDQGGAGLESETGAAPKGRETGVSLGNAADGPQSKHRPPAASPPVLGGKRSYEPVPKGGKK